MTPPTRRYTPALCVLGGGREGEGTPTPIHLDREMGNAKTLQSAFPEKVYLTDGGRVDTRAKATSKSAFLETRKNYTLKAPKKLEI